MTQKQFSIPVCVASILAVALLRCAMPTDTDPAQWKTAIDLPFTNLRLNLGDYLGEMEMGGMSMGDDTATDGDTIGFSISDSMEVNFENELFNFDTSSLDQTLGVVEIQNSRNVTDSFAVPGGGGPVPANTPFHDSDVDTLPQVYEVVFDSTSPPLPVHVHNTSAGAHLDSVIVTFIDNGAVVAADTVATLAPRDSTNASLPLAGKTLDSIITVDVTATIRGGGTITAGDGLFVRFNLDGMKVSSATLLDSIVKFSEEYEETLSLSDTFVVEYVDIDTSDFAYTVANGSDLRVEVIGEMHDVWDIDYCKENNLLLLDSLAGGRTAADSASYYKGTLLRDTINPTGTSNETGNFAFSRARLFSMWDTTRNKAIVPYVYHVRILVTGRRVTISKTDRFAFELKPVHFPYIVISGRLKYPLERATDTSSLDVSFPWNSFIIDSMRGKFRFVDDIVSLKINMDLPESSVVESTKIMLSIFDPADTTGQVQTTQIMTQMGDGYADTIRLDVSPLINRLPDSLSFTSKTGFPAGTHILLHNEKDAAGNYKNNLSLGSKVAYEAKIPFAWEMTDTAFLVLENSRFFVRDYPILEMFAQMDENAIGIRLKIVNQSNFTCNIFALAAPDEYKGEIYGLALSEVSPAILDKEKGKHFFALFGREGLTIPARGDTAVSNIVLDEEASAKFLNTEKDHIRWLLTFPEADADALHDTDYVYLSSSLHLEALARSDSLLTSWEFGDDDDSTGTEGEEE